MGSDPFLLPEIGPDGLAREAPVIAYTEKIIEEGRLQLRKYIDENYSKIRDVERELAELTMEMKLTSGPKKAALELLRKKIEMSTERIHAAKLKEEQAKKAWEAASKVVQDEEAIKQKLCDDLNHLVQESNNSQLTRLEELKRRMEALNSNRVSTSVSQVTQEGQTMGNAQNSRVADSSGVATSTEITGAKANESARIQAVSGDAPVVNGQNQKPSSETEVRGKRKNQFHGRGKGIGAVPKGRSSADSGWTGSGFDVDGRV
ncbi:hypothetical protein SDJN02_25953 [Cucurbita argyrosperma subsp. argyrosperma]|nr:hypothetical protein SDJN02_25953 [Cucurbita argyrosperma subsp. argyrosperma]